jgi:adenine-specific DNA-methyltransferase
MRSITYGRLRQRDVAETAIKLWANTPLQLNIADFTESIAPENEKHRANLLICNPPYIRHQNLLMGEV